MATGWGRIFGKAWRDSQATLRQHRIWSAVLVTLALAVGSGWAALWLTAGDYQHSARDWVGVVFAAVLAGICAAGIVFILLYAFHFIAAPSRLAKRDAVRIARARKQANDAQEQTTALKARITSSVNLPPIWRARLYRIMEIASETEFRLQREQPVDHLLGELQGIVSGLGSLDDEEAPTTITSAAEGFIAWADRIAKGSPLLDTFYRDILVYTCKGVLEKYPLPRSD